MRIKYNNLQKFYKMRISFRDLELYIHTEEIGGPELADYRASNNDI